MEEIEYRHSNTIREALQSGSTERLMKLIPSISEEVAEYYIDPWQQNHKAIMQGIKNGEDITIFNNHIYEILYDLKIKSEQGKYHR